MRVVSGGFVTLLRLVFNGIALSFCEVVHARRWPVLEMEQAQYHIRSKITVPGSTNRDG